MGTKIEYVDSSHMYATNYIRNSKAIAVLWAIFTICYAIISAVAFLTPGNFQSNYNSICCNTIIINLRFSFKMSSYKIKYVIIKCSFAEWVGDLDSENAGRLGLWQVCLKDETSDNCQKQLTDLMSITSVPFQVNFYSQTLSYSLLDKL